MVNRFHFPRCLLLLSYNFSKTTDNHKQLTSWITFGKQLVAKTYAGGSFGYPQTS